MVVLPTNGPNERSLEMASGNTLTECRSTPFISYCSGLACMGG